MEAEPKFKIGETVLLKTREMDRVYFSPRIVSDIFISFKDAQFYYILDSINIVDDYARGPMYLQLNSLIAHRESDIFSAEEMKQFDWNKVVDEIKLPQSEIDRMKHLGKIAKIGELAIAGMELNELEEKEGE